MTSPTLVEMPLSCYPPTHTSSTACTKRSSSLYKPSLIETVQRVAAFVSLAILSIIGFLAILGHAIGFLIAPQVALVLIAVFIISLLGNALYLCKTAPLRLYKELQQEVASLKEVNFLLKSVQREFLGLSKDFATTSKDLSEVSQDFQSLLKDFQSAHQGFDDLLEDYKNSAEDLRQIFSQETVQNLKTTILSLKEEIKEIVPLTEEVRRLAENKEALLEVVQDLEDIRNKLRIEIDRLSKVSKTLGEQIESQIKENETLCANIKAALSKSSSRSGSCSS